MKKIVLLYAIAAFIACSCTGMQEAPEISGVPMVLTAYQEGPADSKTAVEDGGKQVFWEPGDEIKVFSGSRSGRFTSNATGLTEVTEFTGRLEGDEPDVADIWAVYPYSDEASFDGETITTVIPSVQVARPGTFAQGANVAIAHSTTTNLQFYNVGGGIRFSLTEEGVKKVIFEGLGGEVISGTVKVGFEDGVPKVKEVSGGSIFITLMPPEGESFIPGQWYYMVAVPGTLESGFKLRFYKGNTTYARIVSENTYSIKRKLFGSMADVDNSLSYESTTTSFPASEDEWERSVEITEGIVYSANAIIIDEYDGEDIDELVHELEQIEWVIQAVPSPDGTTISINQSDGAWVDLSLVNPVVRTASKQTNDKQIIETSSSPIKKTVIEKGGGRALIMSPFQEQFQYPIEDWCQYLGAYFTVDTLLNSHAGIQDFVWRNHRGRELDDYDFILILTHGSIGSIDSIEDNTVLSTSLCTGTVFNDALAKRLVDDGLGRHFGRFCPYGSTKVFFSVFPSALSGKSFDESAVLLMACHSAEVIKKTGKREFVDAFINKGASCVSGNDVTMLSPAMCQYVELMVTTLCSGFSFQEAHDYATKSEASKDWYTHEATEMRKVGLSYDYLEGMNFCKHTLCFDKSASINYCLFDPSPTLSFSSSSKLSWKSSLDYFQTRWFYHTNLRWENNPAPPYEPILLSDDEARYSGFSITFKVYVDGECQIETVYKEFSIKALRPGDHSAYVEAIVSLNDGSRVINTFKSNTVIFSIKEASIDYQTPEAVDLGLSVKWASFNLGASKPEEYGNYYAWGETAPKNIYDWSTYKWCNGSSSSIMKYVDENEGSILYREDDAASKNLGGSWQMPSYEHFHELVNTDNCALQWTTRNGIEGYKVTSKKNGNSIFLPAGGLMMGADISSFNDHNSGYYAAEYWSSSWSKYSPAGAITLHFDMSSNHLDSGARSYGRLIRPVYPND